MLTHTQGRIDNIFDDTKSNSVASGDGNGIHHTHRKSTTTTASTSGVLDNIWNIYDLQGDSSSLPESQAQLNRDKKRYAFSATESKAEAFNEEEDEDVRETQEKQNLRKKRSVMTSVSCKDELGNNVEWFVAYKLPQMPSHDPLVLQGSKYFYITPNQKSSWQESSYPIHSNKSILGTTLAMLWNNSSSSAVTTIAKLAYNDQPPSLPAVVMNGHTKGIVWTSTERGVWLQHSCPHFPDFAAQNVSSSYPPGGLINGQMFLCLSLENASNVDAIGKMLQYTRPFVYNYSIPASITGAIPELTKVATQNATVRRAPWFQTYKLKAGDLTLTVYAKGPKFRREIYSAWIAPDYETGLDVQSWLNGAHPYMSNCTSNKYPVFNILTKNMRSQNFSHTDDHSKWGVSVEKEKPLVCVGDLNRMKPQRTRGGVAICVSDSQIWSAFNSLVRDIQPCNSTTLKYKPGGHTYQRS